MNTYVTYFSIKCPVNGQWICYRMEIAARVVVMVERIQQVIKELPADGYHEGIAELLTSKLPGQQTLSAHHHGVDIKTVRGEL